MYNENDYGNNNLNNAANEESDDLDLDMEQGTSSGFFEGGPEGATSDDEDYENFGSGSGSGDHLVEG